MLSIKYGIDDTHLNDLLDDKLAESEPHGDPDWSEDYRGSINSGESDDKYIDNLFNSLKE